ncbi:cobalt-precorrin-5B (C(1))-methyltransferase CbiD [Geofilum sp. OHC36d9]|uniref:cobalt-precorrin-5B (C(1))-methyltransferase CbiD n=1 Tax=Geofilum sp. OHC36d9 TaxID=3458413 RepID=UPI004034C4AD
MILLFGGTTEGRKTADVLDFIDEDYVYSTKTEVVSHHKGKNLCGEMDRSAIVSFCRANNVGLIIDAAHPFASQLHQNIHDAANEVKTPVLRYERQYPETASHPNITSFESFEQLTQAILRSHYLKILALTGVQTITALQPVWQSRTCYFRILDTSLSRQKALNTSIPNHLIIPMHPSGDEDELQLLVKKTGAQLLLSKESGSSGFTETKISVAQKMGIPLWMVKRAPLPHFDYVVDSPKELLQQIYRLRKTILKKEGVLRTGYTTGVCTTAAAKACFLALAEKKFPESVQLSLPNGEQTGFLIFPKTLTQKQAACTVIKNGGDDADVTHGKEIGCQLTLTTKEGISFLQGQGIGKVTLPGLPLPVGEPAINPMPRKMISEMLQHLSGAYELETGFEVTPFVPDGEKLALQTFNARVGVVGGISIIGTTGKVKPYSNEAFLATIGYQLSVAHESKINRVVLTSGKRSENMLRPLYPDLPDTAYIHFGNMVGQSLQLATAQKIPQITMGLMFGKAVKLAEGNMDTHSKKSTFNARFAATVADKCRYPISISLKIAGLTIANAIQHIIPFSATEPFYLEIARRCFDRCSALIPKGIKFTFVLLNDEGLKIKINKE